MTLVLRITLDHIRVIPGHQIKLNCCPAGVRDLGSGSMTSRSAEGSAKLPSVGQPFRFSQASLEKIKVPAGQRLKFSDLNGTGARLDATGPNGRHQGDRKSVV